MEELYLETKNGKKPIDAETTQKYHLKAGDYAPFSGQIITGSAPSESATERRDSESSIRQDFYNLAEQGYHDDEIDQMDNGFEFSQSEILDFAQGTDSYTDH